MQTLPEMVETCRSNCASESYPSDDDLHTAHYRRNAALFAESVCVNCGSLNLQKRGSARTKTMEYQRYQCSDCGAWSRQRLAEKRNRKHVLTGVA